MAAQRASHLSWLLWRARAVASWRRSAPCSVCGCACRQMAAARTDPPCACGCWLTATQRHRQPPRRKQQKRRRQAPAANHRRRQQGRQQGAAHCRGQARHALRTGHPVLVLLLVQARLLVARLPVSKLRQRLRWRGQRLNPLQRRPQQALLQCRNSPRRPSRWRGSCRLCWMQ